MSKICVLEKMKSPYKISLYKNGNNPNIYYYFRWKNTRYQGSTGSDILDTSRNKVSEIFFEITKGMRKKGYQKVVRFEDVVKKFLTFKEEHKISPRTLVEYKRQSKYLLERFKGREINSFVSKSEYDDYIVWRRKYYDTHETKRVQNYQRNGEKIKGRTFLKVGVSIGFEN